LLRDEIQFEEFAKRIQRLEEFEMELDSLNVPGFESEVLLIRQKLKDPNNLEAIESDTSFLKNKIEEKIENLISETKITIKKAKSDAINAKKSFWLSALEIFENDLLNFTQEFDSGSVPLKEASASILSLKDEAEVLSVPLSEGGMIEEPGFEKENYYDILGIKRDATSEQIKNIFRRLSLIYHPDTGKHLGVDGEQRFRKIKDAYDTLIDPNKRRKYDEEIGI